MRKHPIRKLLGLTVLYAALIIGIFVIQFKTESVISHNLGLLKITLAQTENENNTISLRNQLQIAFQGITFISNEKYALTASDSKRENSEQKLILSEYTMPTDLSALFTFTDGSTILFAVSDETENASLTVSVNPSGNNDSITIPFQTTSGYTITEQQETRLLLASRNTLFALTAPEIGENTITFKEKEYTASFAAYDPTQHFTFDSIVEYALADNKAYDTTITKIRSDVINKFNQLLNSATISSLTEQSVIAYVAEMASLNKYDEALDAVPESFKKGNKRTYLSSPFFDNLVTMNNSLVMQTEKYASMVTNSTSSKDLDIFLVDGISDYVLRERMTSKIQKLLSMPKEITPFEPTVTQAAGILNMYTVLAEKNINLSQLLEPVIEQCVSVITDYSSVEDDRIYIMNNDSKLGTLQSVQVGKALASYGRFINNDSYVKGGQLIVNSVLTDTSSFDLNTAASLYATLVTDNKFYPHTQILGYYGETPVWAWTCADNITYEKNNDGVIDINIDFTHTKTHYIIFNGVPTFHANIEIQSQKFRTDPRFETYNSSGYVYHADTQTLFIKSRHKSKVELIRLFCDPEINFISAK